MRQTDLNDIVALLAVARAKNFTRAAAQLEVSQSALSQTLRASLIFASDELPGRRANPRGRARSSSDPETLS